MVRYEKTINKVIKIINEDVFFLTAKGELEYKQRIVKDLNNWVKFFANKLKKGEIR
jgi:SRSO17 transposase